MCVEIAAVECFVVVEALPMHRFAACCCCCWPAEQQHFTTSVLDMQLLLLSISVEFRLLPCLQCALYLLQVATARTASTSRKTLFIAKFKTYSSVLSSTQFITRLTFERDHGRRLEQAVSGSGRPANDRDQIRPQLKLLHSSCRLLYCRRGQLHTAGAPLALPQ